MYVGNIVSPFIWILAKSGLTQLLSWLKIYNFFILPNFLSPILRWFAEHFPRFVWRILGLVMGIDEIIRIDISRMPVMLNHEPGGTSYFNMLHWLQSFVSGEFQMLDFGSEEENFAHYGQKTAPKYNTTHISETLSKIPTILFAGENDSLVAPRDLVKLQRLLLPVGVKFVILQHYAHADYIWGNT